MHVPNVGAPTLVSRILNKLNQPPGYTKSIQAITTHGEGYVVSYVAKSSGGRTEHRCAGFIHDGNVEDGLRSRFDMIL